MGFLPMLILHVLIVSYLLSWQQKSASTWLLIGWQSCLFLLITAVFFARTVYSPLSVYLEWMGGTTFAMLGAVFMIQFAYHFPRPFYLVEARTLLIVSGLVWLGVIGLMISEAMTDPGILSYHFKGFLYGFFIFPDEKQALTSFDIFDLLHPLAFVWTLLVWLRQSVRLSQAETLSEQSSWWRLLGRPRGQAALATRNFALLFVAALLTVVISTLEARSYLPDGSFATAYLLVWFGWILVYVNNAPETASFMARLVGISLVTLLAILGLINPLLLSWYDQAYEQARQTELAYLQRLIIHNDLSHLPEPVEYLLARPAARGPFTTDYQLLFSRRPDLTTQDFVEQDARIQESLQQGVALPLLREHPWLGPETKEHLEQTVIPSRTRLYRGALATAGFHFIRYVIRQDDMLYEVGYSYPAYRQALHRRAVSLVWLTGVAVLVILFVFPYFFRYYLVRPLENLLHGVKQVNDGNLTVTVPVNSRDEIGFLTRSFNHMVQSLLVLNTNLRREILERKQAETQRERLFQTEREHRLLAEALHRAGAAINSSLNYEEVLDLILEQINLLVPHDTANIMLLEGQTARVLYRKRYQQGKPSTYLTDHVFNVHEFPGLRQMQATGQPVILTEVESNPDWQPTPETAWIRSYLGVPLRLHSRLVGFLNLNSAVPDFFSQADADRLQGLVNQATTAIENARLFEAAWRATARLAEAEEAERQQLARELHDRVGQNLTALSLNLTTMSTYLAAQSPSADSVELTGQLRSRLEDSKELVKETTQRIRSVMDELRSPVLEEYGLAAALRWYGKQFGQRSGLAVSVEGETLQPRPPAMVENTFFRIAQEALTNTAKHAQASQVTITLAGKEGRLRMVIADNGRGFSRFDDETASGERRRGLGLLTIAERAEAVGGHCLVQSTPGEGTQVIVEVER